MDKYELAVVVSNYNINRNLYETIDAIKNAGFKNVFLEWYDEDWETSQEEQLRYVKEKGLNIIFAHLGYQGINNLWIEEDTGIVERYKKDIKDCFDNGIPMVCMHLTSKSEAPMYNEKGLNRLKEICDYAESLGIKVAFENTKIKGYLDYVIANINNPNVGICYDSGHVHAHFDDEFNFDNFKDRIFAIHLHDNDGTGDQHLLPFEGTIDWDNIISKLSENGFKGYTTLEIHYYKQYGDMTTDEFYKKGYEIGLKLKRKFEEKEYGKGESIL